MVNFFYWFILVLIESNTNYFIAGKKIDVTECERDLGVLVSSDGTWDEHDNSAAS